MQAKPAGRQRRNVPHPVDIHIGSRLRQRRTELGMSQPRTWRSLGHRVSADVQIRTGQKPDQRQPPYELSKVLGVPVAFFFEGIEGTDEGADTEARQSGAIAMTGRTRLPGGEPRKASQRNKRNVASSGAAKLTPVWRASMPVLWKGRAGIFGRDVGDGEHAEMVLDGRIYRVRISELG